MSIIALVIYIYLAIGFLFACYFAVKGLVRLDETASGIGFWPRLLFMPAAMLLWPVIIHKMMR